MGKQLWNHTGRGVTHHAPEQGSADKHVLEFDDGSKQIWNSEAEAEQFKAANGFTFTEKPKPGTIATPPGVLEWLKANGLSVTPTAAPAEAPAAA